MPVRCRPPFVAVPLCILAGQKADAKVITVGGFKRNWTNLWHGHIMKFQIKKEPVTKRCTGLKNKEANKSKAPFVMV